MSEFGPPCWHHRGYSLTSHHISIHSLRQGAQHAKEPLSECFIDFAIMKGLKLILIQRHPHDECIMHLVCSVHIKGKKRKRYGKMKEIELKTEQSTLLQPLVAVLIHGGTLRERGHTLRSKEGKKNKLRRKVK